MYGFWYDELHNDYKLMVIYKNMGDKNSPYNVGYTVWIIVLANVCMICECDSNL